MAKVNIRSGVSVVTLAGLTLTNGTLEVTGPQAGASFDRPFALESAPISTLFAGNVYKGHDGVIVKNDVDLEMPVPQPANAAFFKRGAGRMTLTSEKTAAFPATYGHDVFGYTPAWGEYVFDDEGTVPTDRVYAALSVVEGDLTLKGLGATPVEFDYGGSLMIGVPTKSCTVNPSLTLDNAQYLNKGGGTRLYLGPMMAESISSVTEASLVLTNGSRMTIDTMSIHYNTSTGGRKTRVVVDGSDLVVTYAMEYGVSATAPDDRLTASVHRNRELLRNISVERIYSELSRMLCGAGVFSVLSAFPDVLGVFLPEILPTVGFAQNNPHHAYDVWTHTVHAVAAAPADRVVRLALLFHDLGKPSCYTEDERGGHFYGHHAQSAGIARNVLNRLHSDNETKDSVVTLVDLHDTVFSVESAKQIRRLLARIGPDLMRRLLAVHRADIAGQGSAETAAGERETKRRILTAA